MASTSLYSSLLKSAKVGSGEFKYYDFVSLDAVRVGRLPFSIRVLLESAVRNCDDFQVTRRDVANILDWHRLTSSASSATEVSFRPSRVILQDFTGVPAVVDFAAMRDAVVALGGEASSINPKCPSDLVIDHSVQVDFGGRTKRAQDKNEELEFTRNKERFAFLKWGSKAFDNVLIVPPGSGIVHQVNLEYLARVCFKNEETIVYPDSVVGTDSHTTMIDGLGVLGWGVGGIEAEAVMLGQPISMVLPEVIGYEIEGTMHPMVTSTDVVLTITKHLREIGVVGKFVEFFGQGVASLSIADRATIANMCPEYGATVAFFPVDEVAIDYLRQTDRRTEDVELIRTYLKTTGLFRDYSDKEQNPEFTQVHSLDLASVVPSCSGPKRPHDRVAVSQLKQDFLHGLKAPISFKGYGLKPEKLETRVKVTVEEDQEVEIGHGSVLIAAITSCTNTSNPSVMLGAGLMAKKAVELGLEVQPYVKTSLSPGSGVVTHYLTKSGVIPFLEKLGFGVVGYGCMTCIGNSGPLHENIAAAVREKDLVCAGVLSGNRNFEGRVHPDTRANYLASPPLVIAYAIAGRVDIDFEKEELGISKSGEPVYLRDIWPSREEVQAVEKKHVIPALFREVYQKITLGNDRWNSLEAPQGSLYPWEATSTYIKRPPFFEGMSKELKELKDIEKAFALLHLGDSVTTDHISPAGSIARNSPAARYLMSREVSPRDFNSYGSRRGHDSVMARGTFANIRLVNKLVATTGPKTLHIPSGETLDVWDAAERYREEQKCPLIIVAGKDYGCGSSRDWAAKGPYLQGVKAVIAESYERIHRSNLVGMGLMPLQFLHNESANSLGIEGKEQFTIRVPEQLKPQQRLKVVAQAQDGQEKSFEVIARFDTELELTYFRNGGILNYMVRKMAEKKK